MVLTIIGKENTLWICSLHERLIKFLQKEGFEFIVHKEGAGLKCEVCDEKG